MNDFGDKVKKNPISQPKKGFGNPIVKKATDIAGAADKVSRQPSRLKEKARRLLKF